MSDVKCEFSTGVTPVAGIAETSRLENSRSEQTAPSDLRERACRRSMTGGGRFAIDRANEVLALLKKAYPHAKYYLNFSTPGELVVATILSAQCRDEVVNACTVKLFRKYKSVKDFANAPLGALEKDISAITFFRNKAKAIKEACRIIVEKHHGKVPVEMDALTELPGIGRKTANAILQNAFNKVEGVIVDTHVIRLSQRLGFTKQKNPEKIEKDLMELSPKAKWKRLPWLMKEHGRAICTAPVPKCMQCVLFKLCPKVGVAKSVYA